MKIIFMGTPDFAVPALSSLFKAGHDICAVYTQPPRKAGRGHKILPSAVHLYAQQQNIEVRTPSSLKNNKEELEYFRSLAPDIAVVAAYGLILPETYLKTPHWGCVNIHASLLPRWRGASPIQSALLAGDTHSGVTLMQMDKGLDTGDILSRLETKITPNMTAQHLHDELAQIGGKLITEFVHNPASFPPTPQDNAHSSYAPLLQKEDGKIEWHKPASDIIRQIHAFTPWPGTFTTLNGAIYKIGHAQLAEQEVMSSFTDHIPGYILDDNKLLIQCGQGSGLYIETLQKPGGKMLDYKSFLRGHPLPTHSCFGT